MINKKFVSPALMWLIVLAGVLLIFAFAPAEKVLTQNALTYLLVISAVLYWLYFFSLAVHINRGAASSSVKTDKLIQSGVYGLVRHPIYDADIVLAWGVFLFWPTLRVFLIAIWLTAVLFYWMRLEEKILTEKFGNYYREYKKKVPMFLPRILKK
jgi:protein-S-isoprenylcysteine O-methyltransferase Ste14